MAGEEVVEVIKTALETEREGMELYEEAMKNAGSPTTKQMFKSFAMDERRHLAVLAQFLEDGDFSDIGINFAKRFTGDVRTIFTKALGTGGLNASGSDSEALVKAADFEKNGITFYREKAKSLTDDAAKALCERLAVEEENHLLILENTLEYMDQPGDWFMQEERWMFEG